MTNTLTSENPRIAVFVHFVEDLAKLSKCTDKGVAAIIIDDEASQVYSIGINGGPKHGRNCLCTLGGKYTCAHAEANALAKCTVDCHGKTMLCKLSPCVTCATLIVNAGISRVLYIDKYKDDTGLQILKEADIKVEQVVCDEVKDASSVSVSWHEILASLVAGSVVKLSMYMPDMQPLLDWLTKMATEYNFQLIRRAGQYEPGVIAIEYYRRLGGKLSGFKD